MEQHRFIGDYLCMQILSTREKCRLGKDHPIHIESIRSISLGEQKHEPVGCDLRGRPHLGPCIDPVYQRLIIKEVITNYITDGFIAVYEGDGYSDLLDLMAKRIIDRLSDYRIGEMS